MKLLRAASALPLLAAVLTCGDPAGPTAERLVISGRDTLRLGQTVRFVFAAYDARNQPLEYRRGDWTTSNPEVATVDGDGRVAALATGQATIGVAVYGATSSFVVTVTPRPLGGVALLAGPDTLYVGETTQLAAATVDTAGAPLDGHVIAWQSSDSAKLTVTPAGAVRGASPGTAALTVRSGAFVSGRFMTVLEPPARLTVPDTVVIPRAASVLLDVALWSSTGNRTPRRPVSWSTTLESVARVFPTGVVQARNYGTAGVIATCCGGLADTAVILVPVERATRMAMGARSLTGVAFVGLAVEYEASLTDRFDLESFQPVRWATSDSTVLAIAVDSADSRRARVTARSPGRADLVATSDTMVRTLAVRAQFPAARLSVEPETLEVPLGGTMPFAASLRDSTGAGVTGGSVSFASDTTVTVEANSYTAPTVRGRSAGTTAVVATGSWSFLTFRDTLVVRVVPSPSLNLSFSSSDLAVLQDRSLSVVLRVRDGTGLPLAAGVTVRLAVTDTSILSIESEASPTVRDSVILQIRGRRAGHVALIARADSGSTTARVQVVFDVPQSLRVTAAPRLVTEGDTATLVAEARSPSQVLPYPLSWSSSDTAVAFFLPGGRLVARAPGRTQVRVALDGLSDTMTIAVRSRAGPAVAGTSSPILYRDSAVVITGSGFDPIPTNNVVQIEGLPATVTAASATALTVIVPAADGCGVVRSALLTVTTPDGVTAATVAYGPHARPLPPTGGRLTLRGPAAVACNEFVAAETGRYLFSLVNETGEPATDALGATIRWSSGVPATGAATAAGPGASSPAFLPQLARGRGQHVAFVTASQRHGRRFGSPVAALRGPRPRLSTRDSIGGHTRFRVPRLDVGDFCASYHAVDATRRYTGARLDVYVDTSIPQPAEFLSVVRAMGMEFDTLSFPLLASHFGDPLVLDSLLDRTGKLVLLVTPHLNAWGTPGFVASCDFYPEALAPSSNTGEVIYVWAPDLEPTAFPTGPYGLWRWLTRAVLTHEAKHIASLAQRFSRGLPLEELWVEEGSAVLAEELWARRVHGIAWRGNADYTATIYCEVRACNDRPAAIVNAFALLYDFAASSGFRTPLGPVSADDGSFYGSAWWLLRWLLDQYATDEAAFLRALVVSPATGAANLEARVGRPLGSLVADWMLASRLDDTPETATPFSPPLSIPSWNARSIFGGLVADFPSLFASAYPFAAFEWDPRIETFILRAGSARLRHSRIEAGVRQLVQLDGPLPSTIRLDVLRLY
jgi:hypothetical protein